MRFSLRPGMIVKVHQKIKETTAKGEEKERIQVFEGTVLALRHGKQAGASATVRKVSEGVGVERIFPLHSPLIERVEAVRQLRVRRAKPFYLRSHAKRVKEIPLKK